MPAERSSEAVSLVALTANLLFQIEHTHFSRFYWVASSFKWFVPNAICVAKKWNAYGTIRSI